tara:strand:- start:436 stop:801 length:366 start_codon:yes stop_codon:yes gene_type:complete
MSQPLLNEWKTTIQAYGNGGFKIAGEVVQGSILLTEITRHDLTISRVSETTDAILPALKEAEAELLLVGGGTAPETLPEECLNVLRKAGISVEHMDTGAACRTYGILQSEGRRVAALLIAV